MNGLRDLPWLVVAPDDPDRWPDGWCVVTADWRPDTTPSDDWVIAERLTQTDAEAIVAVANTSRPNLSEYDWENILISAVRYAVGRGTEHLLGTARIVEQQAPWLSGRARSVIVRDITTELGYRSDRVYPSVDRVAWESALDALTAAGWADVDA